MHAHIYARPRCRRARLRPPRIAASALARNRAAGATQHADSPAVAAARCTSEGTSTDGAALLPARRRGIPMRDPRRARRACCLSEWSDRRRIPPKTKRYVQPSKVELQKCTAQLRTVWFLLVQNHEVSFFPPPLFGLISHRFHESQPVHLLFSRRGQTCFVLELPCKIPCHRTADHLSSTMTPKSAAIAAAAVAAIGRWRPALRLPVRPPSSPAIRGARFALPSAALSAPRRASRATAYLYLNAKGASSRALYFAPEPRAPRAADAPPACPCREQRGSLHAHAGHAAARPRLAPGDAPRRRRHGGDGGRQAR
jgi:hypothetical protein